MGREVPGGASSIQNAKVGGLYEMKGKALRPSLFYVRYTTVNSLR